VLDDTRTTSTTPQVPATDAVVPATMRTAWYERYGRPEDVVAVREVPVPTPGPGEVLVRVRAASVNALDWHYVTGLPMFARPSLGLRRPTRTVPGADVAGEVAAAGPGVALRPGDRVLGEVPGGGFAEYVAVPADHLVATPDEVTDEQAATLGVAAETALQALRDWGGLRAGQRVLVIGGSGGVGSFAVRLARPLGAAHVTAVCSTGNVATAREGGADRVVDYTREDVRDLGDTFDLVVDNAGTLPLRDCRRLLTPRGTYVLVTAPKSRWLHPLPRMLATPVSFLLSRRTAPAFRVARRSTDDLALLARMVADGTLVPVVERRWRLDEVAEALRVQGEFHARGKSLVLP
jgi:NADPH:quinone reductase-like Zn-dependent oxidoreductase